IYRLKFDNAPELLTAPTNQTASVGTNFSLVVPGGIFGDGDIGDSLTYSLSSTPTPPAWLIIDPATGALSGTPTGPGVFTVGIVATDLDGVSSTNQVVITVTGGAPSGFAFTTLSAQSSPSVSLTIRMNGTAGYTYHLQRSSSVTGGAWTNITTATADTNGVVTF